MATLASNYATLADLLKNRDPDGSIADVIELLMESNEILDDAVAMEANGKTYHRTTVRTGLPTATWRRFYKGVQPTKSTEAQVDDIMGMLEAKADVDRDLANLSGDLGKFRLSKARGHIQGMNNQMATALFYSDADSTPVQFHGLAPRYSEISADKTKSGYNIVDGGGSGADNTSIWLVTWGDEATSLIYPEGSMAGLQHDDLGEQVVRDGDGNDYRAYMDWYKWDIGLTVQDHRANVRIANLDVSDMAAGTVAIENFMIKAYYKTKRGQVATGKKAWYCNIDVHQALHIRAKDKANVQLQISNFEGQEIVTCMGIPIRTCEAILNNEAQIT